MSHQLVAKKWRFEIPPLNWKAPDAAKESKLNAVPADSESAEDSDTSRSTA
ncbi:hypothetical protein RAS12_06750 [Achromobacter seleniivolatilans]|uniref:Uncharacterized protein n=1 Tax=Achromobacter seleniivolatilans TaxID=3047478 RepID=A0ABY9M624_9BURK|nr:hypothetical protein [Achromobacter sp. R39]WMD22068.1 hypothetical protein RAS12_06750 [Achromobacter sp. R39]